MPDSRQQYFDQIALKQKGKRRRFRYYWNDIAVYTNYFSHEDHSVLEIGCGTGDLLAGIKGKRKLGIDFSEEMVKEARIHHPGIEFKQMAAEALDLNEKFDCIVISNLVGYLDDVESFLQQVKKVCHDQTRIIVTYYNYLWEPLFKMAEAVGIKTKSPKQNWLTLHDLNNLLYVSGFDVYRNAKRMICPVYIPLLSAFLNRYLAKFPIFRFFTLNYFTFAKPLQVMKEAEYSEKYSVTVVIPARNESGNIEDAILRTPKFGKHVEIIFIEGNSTDDTWAKIQEIQQKYQHSHDIKIGRQKGRGKADAVREGYSMATGDILMILDADLTVPPEDLPKFYDAIASGKGDFINGSRLVYPMEKEAMRFLNLLGNRFFSWAFTWLLDQRFKDTLCGTKVLFQNDYHKLVKNKKYFGNFDPFGDFDLIFGAHKLNLKIVEVPIRYRERTYGSTNISRFTHGFILLRMCMFASRKIKFI
ncbi:MAG TPA: bifunctional class I SAM-dependent methyltransferase/glycosyltransferase family 2 protein [Bacteroidia bacterium]|nr:bifunctional class I SAM-dependent methyltransferase/glycosyltransferase family 2 protein [Bacteroidia bacterium]